MNESTESNNCIVNSCSKCEPPYNFLSNNKDRILYEKGNSNLCRLKCNCGEFVYFEVEE